MRFWCAFLLVVCFLLVSHKIIASPSEGSIYYNSATKTYSFVPKVDQQNSIVYGTFDDTLATDGFPTLNIHSVQNTPFDDSIVAYGAGYLEGILTRDRIEQHWQNMNTFTWFNYNNSMPAYVKNFFANQKSWVESKVANNPTDLYWQQVNLIHQQFLGIVDGYNLASSETKGSQSLDYFDLMTTAAFGDLFDIMSAPKQYRPKWNQMNVHQIKTFIEENSHCSALYQFTNSDVYFAHASWFTFSAQIRIWKTFVNFCFVYQSDNYYFCSYELFYKNSLTKSTRVSFSSYPSGLSSNDDYYLTSAGLSVIETTNNIFNNSLYDFVVPESLLCWQRVYLANRLSSNGKEWVYYFSTHNSGTYNNQFMVLNSNLFKPGAPLQNGLLYVAEQIPGHVESADVTNIVRTQGYWPSYNVPFFNYTFVISGYPEMLKQHPELADTIDYNNCARANIFRRDHGKASSVEGMKKVIRYNNYLVDPLQKGSPALAISSRYDLLQSKPRCSGAYDAKVSSVSWLKNGLAEIVNGPTYDSVPAFDWNNAPCATAQNSHIGMPDKFQFPWKRVVPK